MKVIGITGGIGSGKSLVSELLETRLGALIINTDMVAHQLMKKGEVSYNKIVEAFGLHILDSNGEIDRKKLGQEVYGKSDKLKVLNACSHPYVMSHVVNMIELNKHNYQLICVETALPIEAGLANICDESWYIHTPIRIRRNRLKESRGYSDEKIDSILTSQLSDEDYRKLTQVEIINDDSVENLFDKIQFYVEN